ncbi:hypothetical protein GGI13_000601 [Coemansia sp. RSA 455]|nr:hypothetical protein GGI13_000601 [Coemansia sp. RSA 455]
MAWEPSLPHISMLVNSSGQGDMHGLVAIDSSVSMDEHYGAVVEIPEGKSVVFQGIVNVCVLSGAVSVCAYSITPKSLWKQVYASSAAYLNRQIIPLVVNTQGWLKGLGLDLHYSLCESDKPTNYIQLYDSDSIPERSDEAREWSVGNGLAPTINFSGIEACDPRLVWISAMSYERATQMLNSQPLSTASETNDESVEARIGGSQLLAIMDSANRKGSKLAVHNMCAILPISG